MATWQCTVDLITTTSPTEDQVDDVVTALQGHGAALSAGPDDARVGVVLTINDAAVAAQAAAAATSAVRHALATAGLQIRADVGVEAISDQEADRRLADRPVVSPAIPDLVAAGDAAVLLGVSRQRVHQLRALSQFPRPVAELTIGPLWTRASIEHFGRVWDRKPGRRPASPPVQEA